jgi:hypothetical protein
MKKKFKWEGWTWLRFESLEVMKIEGMEEKKCRKLQGDFRDQGFG